MHTDHNQERRQARAKFLVEQYGDDPHTRYIDAAVYGNGRCAMFSINAGTGQTTQAASACCDHAPAAEELATTLATAEPNCDTILSDSQQALSNFLRGRITPKPPALYSEQQSHQACARN